MKKIIIILIVVIFLGGGIFLYFNSKNSVSDGTSGGLLKNFNPFGKSEKNTDPNIGKSDDEIINTEENSNDQIFTSDLKLKQITKFAVAGATIFTTTRLKEKIIEKTADQNTDTNKIIDNTKTNGAEPIVEPETEIIDAVRFVERANGHVYDKFVDKNAIGKISNSTIPGVYEAIFGNNNQSIIYRYINSDGETIDSFIATLGGAQGQFLPDNIGDISLSQEGNQFFYSFNLVNNISGLISSFDQSSPKKQIFNSPYTEWLSQWINKQTILLTTKASYKYDGSVYALNISNGGITKVFGNIPGLTTLANKNGSKIIFSRATNNGPELGIYDVVNKTSESLFIYTMPEKCVWANDNISIICGVPQSINGVEYPDAWYKGLVSFNDKIVQINTNNKINVNLYSGGESLDLIKLKLNNYGNILIFINKKDSTLWSLDI